MIARAAQIIRQGLDLQERTARLLLRLDLGIQGPAVGLARHAGRSLDRSDYWRLCEARMTEPEALAATNDAALQRLLRNDPRKVALLRQCARQVVANRPAGPTPAPLPAHRHRAPPFNL